MPGRRSEIASCGPFAGAETRADLREISASARPSARTGHRLDGEDNSAASLLSESDAQRQRCGFVERSLGEALTVHIGFVISRDETSIGTS